jgi:hypothetical protein
LSWKNGLNSGGSAGGRDGRDSAEFPIPRLSVPYGALKAPDSGKNWGGKNLKP